MKNEFVPYELALRVKRLGFNEPCFSWFEGDILNQSRVDLYYFNHSLRGDNFTSAPTFSQAFRWFRDNHGIQKSICPSTENLKFYFFLHKDNNDGKREITNPSEGFNGLYTNYNTYEEAELACLEKLIEIVEGRGE